MSSRIPNQTRVVGGGPATVIGGQGMGGIQPARAPLGRRGRRHHRQQQIILSGGGYWPYYYPYYSPYWFGGWPYNYPFGYGYAYPGWNAPYAVPF